MKLTRTRHDYLISCDECGADSRIAYAIQGEFAIKEGFYDYSLSLCYRCLKKLPTFLKNTPTPKSENDSPA